MTLPYAIVQTVLLSGALWLLWRALIWFRGAGSAVWRIVTIGFLFRAIGGVTAFFVSYYRLPAAKGYALGHGLWFFALDAIGYMGHASNLADESVRGIVFADFMPSVSYVQTLAAFCLAFGTVVSTGLLVNLTAFLGSCALIVRWDGTREPVSRGGIATLIFLSFSPSGIIWSTQPLKDPMFALVLVASLWSLASWRRMFLEPVRRWSGIVIAGLTFVLAVGLMAGTRWYFAIIVLMAAVFFHVLRAVLDRDVRLSAVCGAVLVLILAGQMIPITGGVFVPAEIRRILSLGLDREYGNRLFSLEEQRRGFLTTPARTQIRSGPLVKWIVGADAEVSESSEIDQDAPRGAMRGEGDPARGFVSGTLSLFLPRFVGQAAGLFEIGGGKGLWWFAEVDTLFFDLVALIVLALLWRNRRTGCLRDPMIITSLVFATGLAGLLGFVVTNFGTMLRLRLLLFLLVALIPAQISASIRETESRAYDSGDEGRLSAGEIG